jgi:thiol-disulfide isomerase/thioredoxin
LRSIKTWVAVAALAIVFAALLFFTRHNRASRAGTWKQGQALLAPDFTLPQLDGQALHLSAYRGKVVLLDFWATWCVPCREEIPHFIRLQDKYRAEGLQIIGVSMDDGPEPVRSFSQEFHVNYPVVMGNAKIGELYGGILGLPIAFLLDPDGRVYAKHIGAIKPEIIEKEVVTLFETRRSRVDRPRKGNPSLRLSSCGWSTAEAVRTKPARSLQSGCQPGLRRRST